MSHLTKQDILNEISRTAKENGGQPLRSKQIFGRNWNKAMKKDLQKTTEQYFEVPERVRGQIKNIVEEVKGGYILIETRPPWDGSDREWSRLPIAKIIFHKPTQTWKLYWPRASGKWELYVSHKSFDAALRAIKEDRHGCFWG